MSFYFGRKILGLSEFLNSKELELILISQNFENDSSFSLIAISVLPSLRPARRFPLSRVWQRSKESRGNGEEGRSYRNRKRHFAFDTVESGQAGRQMFACSVVFALVQQ